MNYLCYSCRARTRAVSPRVLPGRRLESVKAAVVCLCVLCVLCVGRVYVCCACCVWVYDRFIWNYICVGIPKN